MKEIIEIFKMNEIDPKTRARIIIKLGSSLNAEWGMNFTEPIVYELIKLLDPENDILNDKSFVKRATL